MLYLLLVTYTIMFLMNLGNESKHNLMLEQRIESIGGLYTNETAVDFCTSIFAVRRRETKE